MVGLLGCTGPQIRTESGLQMELAAVDFSTVSDPSLSRRIKADLRALRPIVEDLQSLDTRARAYLTELDARPGKYSQSENDEIRRLMLAYLNYRSALFRMVAYHSGYFNVVDEPLRLKSFLIAYTAGLTLYARGLGLVTLFADSPNARRKLNEPEPIWGIPPNVFDTVYDNVTDTANVELLGRTEAYYAANRQGFEVLGIATDPDFGWIPEYVASQEKRVAALAPGIWTSGWTKAKRNIRGVWGKAKYGVMAFVSRLAGDTKVRPAEATITKANAERLRGLLEPGDIILSRKNYYVSNGFLPGFWPHAILYVGTPEELRSRGLANRPWVEKHLARYEKPSRDGYPSRVVEAISEGVVFSSFEEVAHSDFVAVFRPNVSEARKDMAIERAFSHHGKPYDFEFDFFSTDKVVCTELVYRAYDEAIEGERVALEMQRILGRDTYPAIEFVRKFRDESPGAGGGLSFVAYVDGDHWRTAEDLVKTAERPSTPERAGWTLRVGGGWAYGVGSEVSGGDAFHTGGFEVAGGHSLGHELLLTYSLSGGPIQVGEKGKWQLNHALVAQWHPTRLIFFRLGGGLSHLAREPGSFWEIGMGYELVQSLGWALDIHTQYTLSTAKGFTKPVSSIGLGVGIQLY